MILIYITCRDSKEAHAIGTHLLKKRLSACYNVIDGMQSAYWWPPKQGKIEEAAETILLVKTVESKFDEIESQVVKLHSSDTPCLIAIPTVKVASKYWKWIREEMEENPVI